VRGNVYELRFWARADHPLEITCIASKGSPAWDNYGLNQKVRLTTRWRAVTLTFEATQTAADARIQFLCGGETGSFWIDDVSLKEHGEEIYRRDFQNGLVLLNGTRRRQTIDVGEGYARLKGDQAPRYQYILDDGGNAGFKTTGAWREIPLGTKEWHAIPPYRPFSCGQWQSTPGPLVCLLVGPQPECLSDSDSDFPEFAQAVRCGVPGTPSS